jgi:hypothetical protein
MKTLRANKEHATIVELFNKMPDFRVTRDKSHVSMAVVVRLRHASWNTVAG